MTPSDRSPDEPLWRDPAAPAAARVRDLMERMTLREKVAQLAGIWVGVDSSAGTVAPHQHELAKLPDVGWDALVTQGVGQLTRLYGTVPVSPLDGAKAVAAVQQQIVAAGRHGIPALLHEECLTGLGAWQAPIFPSPLCWGATFDPGLVERMAAQIGATMRRLGVHQGLAPVLDVVRDLRWGRVEELIGEDPYLVGTIGAGYVRGLQSAGIVATLKHFAGYSASRAGRNQAPVSMGPRELADVMLPPFEMALRAGPGSVMNSYTDIDGVPVAADAGILTDLLRGEYGFDGTVVADYFSVAFLQTLHGVAGTPAEAAAAALAAGIDVELPTVGCYGEPLAAAVESGAVDAALVDRALERVLRQKCELGLLDPDWTAAPAILEESFSELDDAASRSLALEVARRSAVLLRNNGVLPLAPGLRIALVGPRADDFSAMLGCYSFPRHVGLHHPGVPVGVEIPTLLDALRADEATSSVVYAQGCPVTGGEDEDIEAAARLAADADVCVIALGDLAGLFGTGTSGEGCDAADLRLPGRQEELLEAVLATGTPVVLVLLSGRPYELSRQADRLAAILCGFFPGEQGAVAIAEILAGRTNPTGRLPVGFPAAGSNQPSTYLTPQLGLLHEGSVVDPTPLFPFGHGLSYASAGWTGAAIESGWEWPTDGTCDIAVRLRNDTGVAVSEVVQVYLHDPVAEVVQPVQRLIAAPRVELPPGGTRTVRITLHADQTSFTGRNKRRVVEPGEVELRIGASSADIRAVLRPTLVGPRRQTGADRVLAPEVEVSEP
ncbi:MAG: glycosyl hydrolase [Catenulispora sp. 13_1_20CM_3_70_7]|nr:MAG: glycosyl hydrolase [Catenulispora sp. 13_1_20CM_3_70_7]